MPDLSSRPDDCHPGSAETAFFAGPSRTHHDPSRATLNHPRQELEAVESTESSCRTEFRTLCGQPRIPHFVLCKLAEVSLPWPTSLVSTFTNGSLCRQPI